MLPLLYVVRMDVESDYLDEFVKWYDTRHGPDLINTGFHSCSAYHSSLGAPFICNVYEVPNVEIFSSQAYADVRTHDHQLNDEVLHKISNHSNTTYHQAVTVGIPESALGDGDRPSRKGAIAAPAVSTLRLNIAVEAIEEFKAWFESEGSMSDRTGFMRARLAYQKGKHPTFPSSQPEWIILTEWASVDDANEVGDEQEVVVVYEQRFSGQVSGLDYNVAALSATLLNAHNWAA